MNKWLLSIFILLAIACGYTYQKDKKIHLLSNVTNKCTSNSFITLDYLGQTGNCLFQTAAAVGYALDNNCNVYIKKREIKKKRLHNYLWRYKGSKPKVSIATTYYQQYPYNYEKLPNVSKLRINGYFESEKFFKNHKDTIIDLFSPSKRILSTLHTKYKKIINHPNSVALHIRTFYKDWAVSPDTFYNYFPAPDIKYIEKAISLFPEDSLFVVCSDHIQWCKEHLKHIKRNFVFVHQKTYLDLYLLTLCKHMITTNSTFSWWAAYLNKNPNKIVVAKTPWGLSKDKKSEDTICDEWITIEGSDAVPWPFTKDDLPKTSKKKSFFKR